MDVDHYFNLDSVKKHHQTLFHSYELEYKMPAIDIFRGFVEYKKDVVDILQPDNFTILDISGHSLFSAFLVFKFRYKEYHMFDPGEKYEAINKDIFTEVGHSKNIKYVDEYSSDYDLILDWNGIVNFGSYMDVKMLNILNKMVTNTKQYVIFEAKRFLKISGSGGTFDFFDWFKKLGIKYQIKETPEWLNDLGCLRYILEV